MKFAPILVFCYSRKSHLEAVIESLKANPEARDSLLYVFSDSAKNESTKLAVQEVRSYIKTIRGFKNITIIERNENFGLAKSIINGVSEIIEQHEKAIIVEDDIAVSPFFLRYMNEMLDLYETDTQVASIHSYVYPISKIQADTFFIRGADCWGWATWKRAWNVFEANGSKLLEELQSKNLEHKFDFDGTYPYIGMLKDQIAGKNNSWAIRWNASAFLANMYTLYPSVSHVQNIGFDSSGTHCETNDQFDVVLATSYETPKKIKIEESQEGFNAFKNYFMKQKKSFPVRVINKLKRVLSL